MYTLTTEEKEVIAGFQEQLEEHQKQIIAIEGARQGALMLIARQQNISEWRYEGGSLVVPQSPTETPEESLGV